MAISFIQSYDLSNTNKILSSFDVATQSIIQMAYEIYDFDPTHAFNQQYQIKENQNTISSIDLVYNHYRSIESQYEMIKSDPYSVIKSLYEIKYTSDEFETLTLSPYQYVNYIESKYELKYNAGSVSSLDLIPNPTIESSYIIGQFIDKIITSDYIVNPVDYVLSEYRIEKKREPSIVLEYDVVKGGTYTLFNSNYDISNQNHYLNDITIVSQGTQGTIVSTYVLQNVNTLNIVSTYLFKNINNVTFDGNYLINQFVSSQLENSYKIEVEKDKYIDSLYAISHPIFISSTYRFIQKSVQKSILSTYNVFGKTELISQSYYTIISNQLSNIDSKYEILTSNILSTESIYNIAFSNSITISSLYDIKFTIEKSIISDYTLNTFNTSYLSEKYSIRTTYDKKLDFSYSIGIEKQKNIITSYSLELENVNPIVTTYDIVINRLINTQYQIHSSQNAIIQQFYEIFHHIFFGSYSIKNDTYKSLIDTYNIIYDNESYIESKYQLSNINYIESKYGISVNNKNLFVTNYNISKDYELNINNEYVIQKDSLSTIDSDYIIQTGSYIIFDSLYKIGHDKENNLTSDYTIQYLNEYNINIKYELQNILEKEINSEYIIQSVTHQIFSGNYNIDVTNYINTLSQYNINVDNEKDINIEYKLQKYSQYDLTSNYIIQNVDFSIFNSKYYISTNKIKEITLSYILKADITSKINSVYALNNQTYFTSIYDIRGIKYTYSREILSKYVLHSIHTLPIKSVYSIHNTFNTIDSINFDYDSLHQLLVKYQIRNTLNISSNYDVKHIVIFNSDYWLQFNQTNTFKSIYQLLNKEYITSKYQLLDKKNIFSNYRVFVNLIQKWDIEYQIKHTLNVNTEYQIQNILGFVTSYNIDTTVSHIYVSKDKYLYNVNNTGFVVRLDYNNDLITELQNGKFITTFTPSHDIEIAKHSYVSYDNAFNPENINIQFIVDNYGNKQYIYQVDENTDLTQVANNRFILTKTEDGKAYQFKTNFKFSSNQEYYPYNIYFLSNIIIQYPISNSYNKKQIKKIWLIQENPKYNVNIEVSCYNNFIQLQKDYDINSKYYESPSNTIIFTSDEQKKYYNEYTGRLEIPIKVIVYKNYIDKNSLLVSLKVDIS